MDDVKYNIGDLNTLLDDLNVLDKNGIGKIFYNAPIGISILLPDGNFADVNPTFLQITGYTREEILKIPEQILTHPDDREMNLKFFSEALNSTSDDFEFEKRYLRKDGDINWVKINVLAVRNSQKII